MPISIDFQAIAEQFRPPFAIQILAIQDAFKRLGRWLERRLAQARGRERTSRAFPVIDFFNGAVTAWIDRAQHGTLGPAVAPGFGAELVRGGRRFLDRAGQIPRAVEAGLAIPRSLRALAGLSERIARSVDTSAAGLELRRRLAGLSDAFWRWWYGGESDFVGAFLTYVPRLVPSIAVFLAVLTRFVTALGSGAGPKQLETFGIGVYELMGVFGSSGAPPTTTAGGDPVELLRTVTSGIVVALVALPWLGAYLPALWRTGMIAVRLLVLDLAEGVESAAWDFRAAVLRLFFVDLEEYRREALIWLEAVQLVVTSQLDFWARAVYAYLIQLFDWAREFADVLRSVLGEVAGYVEHFKWASETWYVSETLVQGIQELTPLSFLEEVEELIWGRPILLLPELAPPSRVPFPDLAGTFLETERDRFGEALSDARDAVDGLVVGGIEAGATLLSDLEAVAASQRDAAARSDLAARLADLVTTTDRMAGDLFGPELDWLGAHREVTGWEGVTGSLGTALAAGGFAAIGATIPAYVGAMREFWERERPSADEPPTSPHILARRAELTTVRVPRMTVRAPERPLDDRLTSEIVARFRTAVSDAFRAGEAKFVSAPAAVR